MVKIYLMKDNNHLKNNGYSLEEEGQIYEDNLQEVLDNTKQILKDLDYLVEFRVSWKNYRWKTPTLPLKYTKK